MESEKNDPQKIQNIYNDKAFLKKALAHNKSPDTREPRDAIYIQKNLELIKQIQDKKIKQKEDIELKKKKEQEEREKLKQQILEEAAKIREQKQKNSEQVTIIENKEVEDANKKMKKTKNASINDDDGLIDQQQQEARKQLENYYRSRHATFLMALQENQKKQKMLEENQKKKKEIAIAKIRENMGINNVTSKLFDNNDKNKDSRGIGGGTDIREFDTPKSKEKSPRAQSAGDNEKDERGHSADPQGKIGEKPKIKKMKSEKEEEKVQKVKSKENTPEKRKSLAVNSFNKNTSSTIKGLDLSSFTKKISKNASENVLPVIKDATEIEDENDDDEDNNNDDDNGNDDANNNENNNNNNQSNKGKTKKTEDSPSKSKKQKKKIPIYPNITDISQWKKRHRLDPNTKVFVIVGGYWNLKHALEARGWVENPDPNSNCFDLKWTLRAKDINHEMLTENQVVNHFEKNTTITTKVGLCKSLRNLIWFANVDIDTFYPRGFDLSDPNDYQDFVEEFKSVKAESILKNYLKAYEKKDPNITEMEFRVNIALNICERRLQDLDDLLEDQALISQNMISQDEWEILANDELNQESLAKKKHENWLAKYDMQNGSKNMQQEGSKSNENGQKKAEGKKKGKKKKKKKTTKISVQQNNEEEAEEEEEVIEQKLIDRVEKCCQTMKKKYPQFDLNGEKNIWIVKPAGLSRGRGIEVFRNLVEIEDHVKSKESQWVVQKYIENPLILMERKFDIRQWVLVTDWNPLTIWYYEECYMRFSAEKWNMDKINDKFIHLTNNSIAKYSEQFDNSEIEGNMWTCEEFQQCLMKMHGSNVFLDSIKPKMKQIVIWSLECVQDMVENRKNSMELYGYDFMIDENLNPWLIEINSSPAMDYSTSVTERLVKMVMEDTAKVVVDYDMSKKKKKSEIDTGLFTCIYKSKRTVDKPLNSFGLDLICEGKAIKK